jgi:hypothetical protein
MRVVLVDSDGGGLSHVSSVIERTGSPKAEDLREIFSGPQEVHLGPGDGVLLRGDRHSWRAGPQGCRMLIALIGAENSPGSGHWPGPQ